MGRLLDEYEWIYLAGAKEGELSHLKKAKAQHILE